MIAAYYPHRAGSRPATRRSSACAATSLEQGSAAPMTRRWRAPAGDGDEASSSSSTRSSTRATPSTPTRPASTKNATPTPFGIVYPPAYAERNPAARATLRVEVVLEHGAEAAVSGVGALPAGQSASATRGRAAHRARRRSRSASSPRSRSAGRSSSTASGGSRGGCGCGPSRSARASPGSSSASTTRPSSRAPATSTGRRRCSEPDLDPRRAARHRRDASSRRSRTTGRTAEAVAGCENVNTWPVLPRRRTTPSSARRCSSPTIPRIAPESLGNLFDNTEIEEALLLHVQTLSEDERGQIAAQDPKVREMIERAEQATPEEMIALHGRLEPGHPQSGEPDGDGRPATTITARARGSSCGRARTGATPTTRSSPGARRRSSGSTSTTTTRSTSASPSMTTRARS